METVAFAFILTLLIGLLWLFIFDMFITGGAGYMVAHDHNMDGIHDDPTGGLFHVESPSHNHAQNANIDGTLGRYPNNLSHPNHYFQ